MTDPVALFNTLCDEQPTLANAIQEFALRIREEALKEVEKEIIFITPSSQIGFRQRIIEAVRALKQKGKP